MEFKPSLNTNPPKNLYPCLATITLGPSSDKSSRRLSGSAVSDEEGGLKRVISGGRRKTSFGQVADRGDIRRSIDASAGAGGGGAAGGGGGGGGRKSFEGAAQAERGTWYWRVQAGVNDTHLVLLPLSQPANPLLTSAPAPLSEVMPSHSTAHAGSPGGGGESIGTKMKNLLTGRRQSKISPEDKADADTSAAAGNSAPKDERILDQSGGGAQLPSAAANAVGANNTNANAETGWPGIVGGEKLAAVMVSLSSIDQHGVKLHETKKEGSYVTVPITAHLAGVGQTSELAPKSGYIKFEFDKDWIGAKGEAELLHHYITSAAQNPPAPASHFANQNFQLGGGGGGGLGGSPRATAPGLPGVATDVAPDQSVSTASSGKVAGTA